MSVFAKEIPPEKFYGRVSASQEKIEAILKKKPVQTPTRHKFMNQLLGPSKTWKVFKKQQDAIEFCHHRRNGLMCFAFEDVNNRRMFLVAHPKVFWSFNSHRFFKSCSTYEIIQEYSACKLYLDIEYEFEYNRHCDGEKMLKSLLKVINFNLNKFFKIKCTLDDIIDLDSSSRTKFSHHIIYQIKNTAFQDNYTVGNFIKKILSEIKEAYENCLSQDNKKLREIAEKYELTENDLLEFFINDHKNKTKLFVDEGVYTKNRHFRTYGSSKLNKNIPLVISKNNRYKPEGSLDLHECNMFLDSLITYFSWRVDKILEFEECENFKRNKMIVLEKSHTNEKVTEPSLYPQVDSFIRKLIFPSGRIRRKVFFSDSSTIVYDIQDFRYCDNIKRQHKSNNIKYIVDLNVLGFYQKCYDPECSNFRSDMKPLPDDIRFFFEDDGFLVGDSVACDFSGVSDECFVNALDNMEMDYSLKLDDITDDELGKVVDYTEAILEIEW